MRLTSRAALLLMTGAAVLMSRGSVVVSAVPVDTHATQQPAYRWQHGPPADEHYFPIAVWLQNPRNAARYKAAGINLYVGLWRGPTEEQLAQLRAAGVSLICAQTRTALEHRDDPLIIGWMHGDEPDNAQSLGKGKGYGPPILPERIIADYQRMRSVDPTRPILLNLGQGVAWDNYIGRGVRRNHPEDYQQYVKGCDIASFDIYPVVHDAPEIAGKLQFVGRGVERLVGWTAGEKIVWNCIECTHISNPSARASPEQVRSEVWMALVHGSRGLIYFVHQFKPGFKEAALLDDPVMLAAVTSINQQVHELAPVLNSITISGETEVHTVPVPPSDSSTAPIAWIQKRYRGAIYLFAVNMENTPVRAEFSGRHWSPEAQVRVLGETRLISIEKGRFRDEFQPYAVHLYAVADQENR